MTVTPADGAAKVRPDAPVVVRAQGGRLETVTVKDEQGGEVPGRLDGSSSWSTVAGGLTGGARYTVDVTTVGEDGTRSSRSSSFRTFAPARTNRATLLPGDDKTVGVGMPVIVRFADAVRNRTAVQAALTVSSKPAVDGAWGWVNDREVHWRPATYWPAGTKVAVRAALGGVETSRGVWGRRTVTTNYSIGRSQVSTVDVAKHIMTVRRDGKVVRTIPVTTGKTGFQTRNGVKVVMSRDAKVRMNAGTTGTDPADPEFYDLQVKWAMRLTYSGEFLHAAPWSARSHGKANVSHGCTGMSDANARWMYENSLIGDVVVFKGSKRSLEAGNGYTDWNQSFSAWAKRA